MQGLSKYFLLYIFSSLHTVDIFSFSFHWQMLNWRHRDGALKWHPNKCILFHILGLITSSNKASISLFEYAQSSCSICIRWICSRFLLFSFFLFTFLPYLSYVYFWILSLFFIQVKILYYYYYYSLFLLELPFWR